jgi:aryl-alcohol dehydrogenase-like predicted oxidoreductase
MNYVFLGRTGLKVSPLCLGTMNFGPHTTEKDSFAIMDKALELGINFFDTANVYGGKGATEEIIGRWLAQGSGRRERIILATKMYGGATQWGDWPNLSLISAAHIRYACDQSLKRLQTDYIDLYQMHHIFRQAPWQEIWQAMDRLIQQGKITYVGSSNFAGWDVATANQEASKKPTLGLVSEQSIYHLNNRMVELEVLPACKHYGVGMIPWSPLGGGLLGGALEKHDKGRRGTEEFTKRVNAVRPQLQAYENLCRELGEQPANVALAWLLHNDAVTAPIIGPRTMDQLTGSIRASEITLNKETLKKLDEIWPGPGGEAPNAYAW